MVCLRSDCDLFEGSGRVLRVTLSRRRCQAGLLQQIAGGAGDLCLSLDLPPAHESRPRQSADGLEPADDLFNPLPNHHPYLFNAAGLMLLRTLLLEAADEQLALPLALRRIRYGELLSQPVIRHCSTVMP